MILLFFYLATKSYFMNVSLFFHFHWNEGYRTIELEKVIWPVSF